MESSQIYNLVTKDPFLKRFKVSIISEIDTPYRLLQNHFFFILVSIKKRKIKGKITSLGHWILIDTLHDDKISKSPQLAYFDPMGKGISSKRIKESVKRSEKHSNLFINRICYQHSMSAICGPIVCYIALLRARGFSYSTISTKKISRDLMINVKYIPMMITILLSKKYQFLPRFSLDFFL